jgi:hypothetical protein
VEGVKDDGDPEVDRMCVVAVMHPEIRHQKNIMFPYQSSSGAKKNEKVVHHVTVANQFTAYIIIGRRQQPGG